MRYSLSLVIAFLFYFEVEAVTFEKLGQAVKKVLKSSNKVRQTTVKVSGKPVTVLYTSRKGKPKKYAIIQKRIYDPNCTHTWVIGVNPKSAKVTEVRVVEMSCPHAHPTNKSSYLGQYKGRGPASVKTLDGEINTIAKATGTSNLTTDAVKTSIRAAVKLKKKFKL